MVRLLNRRSKRSEHGAIRISKTKNGTVHVEVTVKATLKAFHQMADPTGRGASKSYSRRRGERAVSLKQSGQIWADVGRDFSADIDNLKV